MEEKSMVGVNTWY